MSDDKLKIENAPVVLHSRIKEIRTLEVQEMELDQLDALYASENQSLAFTTFSAGVFAPTLITWLTTSGLSDRATAVYFATVLVSAVFTLWFGVTWLRARKERPKFLTTVRERCISVENRTTTTTLSPGTQPRLPPQRCPSHGPETRQRDGVCIACGVKLP
jgi:hypothetical protein